MDNTGFNPFNRPYHAPIPPHHPNDNPPSSQGNSDDMFSELSAFLLEGKQLDLNVDTLPEDAIFEGLSEENKHLLNVNSGPIIVNLREEFSLSLEVPPKISSLVPSDSARQQMLEIYRRYQPFIKSDKRDEFIILLLHIEPLVKSYFFSDGEIPFIFTSFNSLNEENMREKYLIVMRNISVQLVNCFKNELQQENTKSFVSLFSILCLLRYWSVYDTLFRRYIKQKYGFGRVHDSTLAFKITSTKSKLRIFNAIECIGLFEGLKSAETFLRIVLSYSKAPIELGGDVYNKVTKQNRYLSINYLEDISKIANTNVEPFETVYHAIETTVPVAPPQIQNIVPPIQNQTLATFIKNGGPLPTADKPAPALNQSQPAPALNQSEQLEMFLNTNTNFFELNYGPELKKYCELFNISQSSYTVGLGLRKKLKEIYTAHKDIIKPELGMQFIKSLAFMNYFFDLFYTSKVQVRIKKAWEKSQSVNQAYEKVSVELANTIRSCLIPNMTTQFLEDLFKITSPPPEISDDELKSIFLEQFSNFAFHSPQPQKNRFVFKGLDGVLRAFSKIVSLKDERLIRQFLQFPGIENKYLDITFYNPHTTTNNIVLSLWMLLVHCKQFSLLQHVDVGNIFPSILNPHISQMLPYLDLKFYSSSYTQGCRYAFHKKEVFDAPINYYGIKKFLSHMPWEFFQKYVDLKDDYLGIASLALVVPEITKNLSISLLIERLRNIDNPYYGYGRIEEVEGTLRWIVTNKLTNEKNSYLFDREIQPKKVIPLIRLPCLLYMFNASKTTVDAPDASESNAKIVEVAPEASAPTKDPEAVPPGSAPEDVVMDPLEVPSIAPPVLASSDVVMATGEPIVTDVEPMQDTFELPEFWQNIYNMSPEKRKVIQDLMAPYLRQIHSLYLMPKNYQALVRQVWNDRGQIVIDLNDFSQKDAFNKVLNKILVEGRQHASKEKQIAIEAALKLNSTCFHLTRGVREDLSVHLVDKEDQITKEMSTELVHAFVNLKIKEFVHFAFNLDILLNRNRFSKSIPLFLLSQDTTEANLDLYLIHFHKGFISKVSADKNNLCEKLLFDQLGLTYSPDKNYNRSVVVSLEMLQKLRVLAYENRKDPQFIILERTKPPFPLVEGETVVEVVEEAAPVLEKSSEDELESTSPEPKEKKARKNVEKEKRTKLPIEDVDEDLKIKSNKRRPLESSSGPMTHQFYKEKGALKRISETDNNLLKPMAKVSRKNPEELPPLPLDQPKLKPEESSLQDNDPDAFYGMESVKSALRTENKIKDVQEKSRIILEGKPMYLPVLSSLKKLGNSIPTIMHFNPRLKNYQIKEVAKIMHFHTQGVVPVSAFKPGVGKSYVCAELFIQMISKGTAGNNIMIVPVSLITEMFDEMRDCFKEAILAAWKIHGQKIPQMKKPEVFYKELKAFFLKGIDPVGGIDLDQLNISLRSVSIVSFQQFISLLGDKNISKHFNETMMSTTVQLMSGYLSKLLDKQKDSPDNIFKVKAEILRALSTFQNNIDDDPKLKEQIINLKKSLFSENADIVKTLKEFLDPKKMCNQVASQKMSLAYVYFIGQLLDINPTAGKLSRNEQFSSEALQIIRNFPLTSIFKCETNKVLKNSLPNPQNKVLITSYEAIKSAKLNLSEYPIATLVVDEAQDFHTEASSRFKFMRDMMAMIISTAEMKKSSRPAMALLTGTPFENNFSELWTLLYLANQKGFDSATHNAFTQLLKDTDYAISSSKNHVRNVLNSFAHMMVFKNHILAPMVTRLEMTSHEVEKEWPNQVPKKIDISVSGNPHISEVAKAAFKKAEEDFQALEATRKGKKVSKANLWSLSHAFKRILIDPKLANESISKAKFKKKKPDEVKDDEEVHTESLAKYINDFKSIPAQSFDAAIKDSTLLTSLFANDEFQNIINTKEHAIIIIEHHLTGEMIEHSIKTKFGADAECRIFSGDLKKEERTKLLQWFRKKEGKAKFLAITHQAGGRGLNLGIAKVVFEEEMLWNNSKEEQARARAIRIGTPGERKVVKFTYNGHFFYAHYKAIQEVKSTWEAFLWNDKKTLKEQLDLWCVTLEAMCYHSALNKYKDLEKVASQMNTVKANIASVKRSVEQDVGVDVGQRLADLIAQATPDIEMQEQEEQNLEELENELLEHMMEESLLTEAPQPSLPSQPTPISTAYTLDQVTIIPLPKQECRLTGIKLGQLLAENKDPKLLTAIETLGSIFAKNPPWRDLIRRNDIAKLGSEKEAQAVLENMEYIMQSISRVRDLDKACVVQEFEWKEDSFRHTGFVQKEQKVICLDKRQRKGMDGKVYEHFDLLIPKIKSDSSKQMNFIKV